MVVFSFIFGKEKILYWLKLNEEKSIRNFHFSSRILQKTDERVKIMSEIIKSMRIVKMYCWENSFIGKICSIRKLVLSNYEMLFFRWFFFFHRKEIIQRAFKAILDGFHRTCSYNYVCVSSLIIYAVTWISSFPMDIRLFAIVCSLLNRIEFVVSEMTWGVTYLANYLAAEKRLTVSHIFLSVIRSITSWTKGFPSTRWNWTR